MPAGRTPKPQAQRRNRAKPVVAEVEVASSPPAGFVAPALPPGRWRVETVRWFEAWRTTPAAVQFSSTEWERLARAVVLCEAYWLAVEWARKGRWVADAKGVARRVVDYREVRDAHAALLNAEKGLPATDYERRRNGIQVKREPPEPAGSQGGEVVRLKVV